MMKKSEDQMFKYEPVCSYTSYIPFPQNSQKEIPGSVISSGTDTNHGENILHSPTPSSLIYDPMDIVGLSANFLNLAFMTV